MSTIGRRGAARSSARWTNSCCAASVSSKRTGASSRYRPTPVSPSPCQSEHDCRCALQSGGPQEPIRLGYLPPLLFLRQRLGLTPRGATNQRDLRFRLTFKPPALPTHTHTSIRPQNITWKSSQSYGDASTNPLKILMKHYQKWIDKNQCSSHAATYEESWQAATVGRVHKEFNHRRTNCFEKRVGRSVC